MDTEVMEILKKNLELAEEKLNGAPFDRVDEYLGKFIEAKKDYITYLNSNM